MDAIGSKEQALTPLENSFVVDEIEADLKRLFLDLFNNEFSELTETLSEQIQETNVYGMAHLGSFELVRRFISEDGLLLLNNKENEIEANTRRLYRAWKAGHLQGRGLHFLASYLQLLFPNNWTINQQMQLKTGAYPDDLVSSDGVLYSEERFLTSRIKIEFDPNTPNLTDIGKIAPIIKDVIPARFIPDFIVTQYSASPIRVLSMFTGWQVMNTHGTASP